MSKFAKHATDGEGFDALDHIRDDEAIREILSLEAIFPGLSPKLQATVRDGLERMHAETGEPTFAKKLERIASL